MPLQLCGTKSKSATCIADPQWVWDWAIPAEIGTTLPCRENLHSMTVFVSKLLKELYSPSLIRSVATREEKSSNWSLAKPLSQPSGKLCLDNMTEIPFSQPHWSTVVFYRSMKCWLICMYTTESTVVIYRSTKAGKPKPHQKDPPWEVSPGQSTICSKHCMTILTSKQRYLFGLLLFFLATCLVARWMSKGLGNWQKKSHLRPFYTTIKYLVAVVKLLETA